ncbi:DUF1450 domain-containing protein [Caldibacillus debilis]|jgi:uncharacterized protein YuzB (UPF0349 family)|uniref:DUF1450 domain-containing protein n=1 Tax=Caldibacillus debilis TaxID=301148 RepID=UPI002FD913BE
MGLFSKKNKPGKLYFCTNNLNRFYDDDAFDRLEGFVDEHGLKVREMDCLSYCEECECSPYALFNREFIAADTPDELIEKLKRRVSEA